MSTIVTLTDSAKEHMTTMLKENSKKAVRLALKGGGCAGFKYDWSLEDKVADDDEVVDFEKGKFVVDPASVMYLLGSTIDYKKTGRNEKCPCGSGKKFKHCHGKI